MRAFDRQQLPMRIAAEIFGEDLQLSLLSRSGGLSLIPVGKSLSVVDFSMRATVTLIGSIMPNRFDSAVDRLVVALRTKKLK
jgi:hypothetical protein